MRKGKKPKKEPVTPQWVQCCQCSRLLPYQETVIDHTTMERWRRVIESTSVLPVGQCECGGLYFPYVDEFQPSGDVGVPPLTSLQAVAGLDLALVKQSALAVYEKSGPYGATFQEVCDATGYVPNTMQVRINELCRIGAIRKVGFTRQNRITKKWLQVCVYCPDTLVAHARGMFHSEFERIEKENVALAVAEARLNQRRSERNKRLMHLHKLCYDWARKNP